MFKKQALMSICLASVLTSVCVAAEFRAGSIRAADGEIYTHWGESKLEIPATVKTYLDSAAGSKGEHGIAIAIFDIGKLVPIKTKRVLKAGSVNNCYFFENQEDKAVLKGEYSPAPSGGACSE